MLSYILLSNSVENLEVLRVSIILKFHPCAKLMRFQSYCTVFGVVTHQRLHVNSAHLLVAMCNMTLLLIQVISTTVACM